VPPRSIWRVVPDRGSIVKSRPVLLCTAISMLPELTMPLRLNPVAISKSPDSGRTLALPGSGSLCEVVRGTTRSSLLAESVA
jgi:hypothetical protein